MSREAKVSRGTSQQFDARRDVILAAAARLFARKGISEATMAEIAGEAGLTAGAIYRYFDSKDELLRAVYDDVKTHSRELFSSAAEHASSPLSALQEVGRKVWIETDDRDDLICEVQMALLAARSPEDFGADLFETRTQIRALLREMVVGAQSSGEIDPAIDADHLAVILQACTAGIQMLKLHPEDDFDVEAVFDLFVTMVTGLRPGPEAEHEG